MTSRSRRWAPLTRSSPAGTRASRTWRAVATRLLRDRICDEPQGLPAGAGPVWTGGFAFDPGGGSSPHWSSFPPALMILPELSMMRRRDETLLTVCVVAGDGAQEAVDRLRGRLAALSDGGMPLLDPHPSGGSEISSPAPPGRL